MAAPLSIDRYDVSLKATWDEFVQRSKNGTFLFYRDYMEYHGDRFDCCSLLVSRGGEVVAILPAHRIGDEVYSHQGLTYGGFTTSETMTTPLMLEIFAAVIDYLRRCGFRQLFYKAIPSIYHRIPAEEDRYALFVADAVLYRWQVLSAVSLREDYSIQVRRRRGAAKADRFGVVISRSTDWAEYWALLSDNIQARFGTTPVHSLAEITQLKGRFPDNIHLHTATLGNELIAGTVIFETATAARTQYIASNMRGRTVGALDKLLIHLLSTTYAHKKYFDFGSSNAEDPKVLNRGLIDQKEGFGARAIAHDFYRLQL